MRLSEGDWWNVPGAVRCVSMEGDLLKDPDGQFWYYRLRGQREVMVGPFASAAEANASMEAAVAAERLK